MTDLSSHIASRVDDLMDEAASTLHGGRFSQHSSVRDWIEQYLRSIEKYYARRANVWLDKYCEWVCSDDE